MDESKFNRLSLAERADIVWDHGQFVDSTLCSHYCLMLYSINDRFIEVFIDLHTQNTVWVSLANGYDLEKYLEHIEIEVGGL